MFITDAVILQGARTPMARYMGSFDNTSAIELGAAAGREAVRRAGADPAEFDHVIFGNVMQTSADALYGARHVGLKAGLPIETPAVTVNRLCGSGFEAVVQGAAQILLGDTEAVLVAGTENMTQAPFQLRGARDGWAFGKAPPVEDSLWSALTDSYTSTPMAVTAENLAVKYGISRTQCDEFALTSQQRWAAANEAGRFKSEIAPIELQT